MSKASKCVNKGSNSTASVSSASVSWVIEPYELTLLKTLSEV